MIMLCMFLKHYFLYEYADWSFVSARSTFKFSLNLIPGAKSVMGKKTQKNAGFHLVYIIINKLFNSIFCNILLCSIYIIQYRPKILPLKSFEGLGKLRKTIPLSCSVNYVRLSL